MTPQEDILLAVEDDTGADELTGDLLFDGMAGRQDDADEFDDQVKAAQQQLSNLRQQQEEIERQKAEIEELKRQRREFLQGRTEATEKLSRAVVMLDREVYECQKRVEEFLQAKDNFAQHLERIDAVNPESWSRAELRTELARALGIVDDARQEYRKSMARLSGQFHGGAPVEDLKEERHESKVMSDSQVGLEPDWFHNGLRRGFAFSLPLMGFGLFALFFQLIFG